MAAALALTGRVAGAVDYTGGTWREDFRSFAAGEPPAYGAGWFLYRAGPGGGWTAAGLDAGLFVRNGSLHTYARGGSHLAVLVFRNAGDLPIKSFRLGWTGEQWTITGAGPGDYLAVGYAVVEGFAAPIELPPAGLEGVLARPVVDLSALRFEAPRFGLRWMAIDGKLEGNRKRLETTVEGLIWMPGQYLVLRWLNLDQDGDAMVEQELAIAEVEFEATFASRTLEVTVEGGGRVEREPARDFYAAGETVTLTAVADRWYAFAGWGDGDTNNPRAVVIGQTNAYTPIFTPVAELETIERDGASRTAPVGTPQPIVNGRFVPEGPVVHRGPVTVELATSFGNGTIFYTLDGSDPFERGLLYARPLVLRASATLRAAAYDGDFARSAAMDPLEIRVLPVLTATTAGGGVVAVDPPEGAYGSNETAVVTAVPQEGWQFLQWFGDAAGTNASATLTMDRSRRAEAVFGAPLEVETVGAGQVIVDPPGPLHPYGSRVRLTAVPEPGHHLAFWRGEGDRTENPLALTITSPPPVWRAVFAALPADRHSLVVVSDGAGTVRVEPAAAYYPAGTEVWLHPEPEPGQLFTGWDDTANVTAPLRVVVEGDRVVTARFTRRARLWVEPDRSPLGEPLRLRVWAAGLPPGSEAILAGSSDLRRWEPVDVQLAPFGRAEWWVDPSAGGPAPRFYRLQP